MFKINGEIFDGIPLLDVNTAEIGEENKQIYDALDTIDDSTQAKFFPLLVAGSLLISFFFLGLTSSITETVNETKNLLDIDFLQQLQKDYGNLFLQFISFLTLFSNAAVCSLFSKAEIQSAFSNIFSQFYNKEGDGSNSNNKNNSIEILMENKIAIPFIISLIISVISFFCPPGGSAWPVQNILNVCIAVTVGNCN